MEFSVFGNKMDRWLNSRLPSESFPAVGFSILYTVTENF
jgi:hypothetical protein